MKKRSYQKELDRLIEQFRAEDSVPRLLLHSCCAPCSSAVLESLSDNFEITVFYYNPNITDEAEYRHRVAEQRRLVGELPTKYPVTFVEGTYEPEKFLEMAKGLEKVPEGGERCRRCFALRLTEAAKLAAREEYDFFCTTLTLSPLKNAETVNEIGERIAAECGVPFLPSDFKKRDGYRRSLELSKEYGLYRQDYCGCVYSKAERERKKQESETTCGACDSVS